MSEPHKGWFAVEEEAIRKLKSTYDRPSAYRLALLAYVTVCRIANLEGRDSFVRTISSIAQDAGLSYNATAEALALIRSASLIKIDGRSVAGTKERAPSQYSVIRMFPMDCGTSPIENGRLPKTRKSQVLPRVPKNSPKNNSKNYTKGKARPLSPDEIRIHLLSLGQTEADATSDGEYYWLHWQENNFTNGGKPIRDWKLTLSKWKAAGFLQSQKRNAVHVTTNGKKPSSLRDDQTF